MIDHSIMFYLMDEQGNFVDYFGKSLSVEAIADKISRFACRKARAHTHAHATRTDTRAHTAAKGSSNESHSSARQADS